MELGILLELIAAQRSGVINIEELIKEINQEKQIDGNNLNTIIDNELEKEFGEEE